jgi:hypothetical protein
MIERETGFYWVKWQGRWIVVEWMPDRSAYPVQGGWWHRRR